MRNGILAAAAAMAFTAAFFLVSGFRQPIAIAAVTLTGRPESYSRIGAAQLDKMRALAEQHGDAAVLAFAALHDRRTDIAHQSAASAVSIDPTFTWVYYDLAFRRANENQRASDLARVQQWDPENGLVYLAQAEPLGPEAMRLASVSRWTGSEPWVQMVARAFDTPRYSSYQREAFDLEREVARKQGNVNPLRLAIASGGGRLPAMMLARRYAEYVLDSSKGPDQLASQSRRVAAFGERMMAGSSDVEKWEGRQLASLGYEKLDSIAAPSERELIASRAAQLASPRQLMTPDSSWSWTLAMTLRPNALTIEASFVVIVIAIIAMAAATVAAIIRRPKASKTMSRIFWASAVTLLTGSVACYVAYQPFATLLRQAMNPETSSDAGMGLVHAYYSYQPLQLGEVYLWAGLTLLLFLALAVLLGRKLRRAGTPTPAPSVS